MEPGLPDRSMIPRWTPSIDRSPDQAPLEVAHGEANVAAAGKRVAYFGYDGVLWSGEDKVAAIAAAMRFLQGVDGYILDLRQNGGGSTDAVAAIASYFLP